MKKSMSAKFVACLKFNPKAVNGEIIAADAVCPDKKSSPKGKR
jgi:hypothetical protein